MCFVLIFFFQIIASAPIDWSRKLLLSCHQFGSLLRFPALASVVLVNKYTI